MNEEYVFEVIEAQYANGRWKIKGLAFSTINEMDLLSAFEKPNGNMGKLQIVDIVTYERQVDMLVRGLTGTLILETINDVDLTKVKYLYKVSS